jgi:hypothetical protein
MLPIAALVIYRLYRRSRSQIGPQPVQPRRMTLRVVIFGVVAALLLASPIGDTARLEMLAAILLGAGLAWYSLHLTSFQRRGEERYYTPNLYIGLAVTALFVLRIGYRFVTVYLQMQQGGAAAAGSAPPGQLPFPLAHSPQSALTLASFGLVLGYYAVYYTGVIVRSRNAPPVLTPMPDKV